MKLIKTIKNLYWPAFILLMIASCVEPYTPPVTKDESNLLVVEGFINTITNTVQVKLSRSVALSKKQTFPAELKATVSIESEDGTKIPLLEKTGGNYEKTGLTLNASKKYRLRIVTKGVAYSSNFIPLMPSPVLDMVGWKPEEKGTTIYADAHDPTGVIKYYKWNYTETWQYHSNYSALYKMLNGVPTPLTPAEECYTCWTTLPAPNLLLASTAHLTQN
ncbi:MAG TPA: DUF4249 family protein, partial [Cyclobacteriaceae bacterium]|nr:DUF4249 family protein [Cyclobacteriaceae bacterium]